MKRIAIVGSRGFNQYELMKKFILERISPDKIELVVSGGARGADTLGEQFADEFGIEKLIFLPDWKRYGKGAGPLRNTDIIKNSDIVFVFHDGVSRGAMDDINKAFRYRKELFVCKYNKKVINEV